MLRRPATRIELKAEDIMEELEEAQKKWGESKDNTPENQSNNNNNSTETNNLQMQTPPTRSQRIGL